MERETYQTFAIAVFLVILAIITYVKDRKEKENRFLHFLLFIGAIILITANTYQGIGAIDENKKTEEKNDSIRNYLFEKQNEIISLEKRQQKKSDSVILLSKLLADKNEEIINLQKYALDQTTGGNNKPIILFGGGSYGYKTARSEIQIKNVGKTIVKDVNIYIQDYQISYLKLVQEAKKLLGKDSNTTQFNLPLPDHSLGGPYLASHPTNEKYFSSINTNEFRVVYDPLIDMKYEKIDYGIDVTWSNGSYSLKIDAKIINTMFYLKNCIIYSNGHQIYDEEKFFNYKVSLPSEYIYIGDVTYNNAKYLIYWYKDASSVIARKNASIYYTLFEIKASSNNEVILETTKAFKKIFD